MSTKIPTLLAVQAAGLPARAGGTILVQTARAHPQTSCRRALHATELHKTSTAGSRHSFTCSTCLNRQSSRLQSHHEQQRALFSSTSATSADPQSPSQGSGYASELQQSTGPSDTSPIPQRRAPRWAATPAGLQTPFPVRSAGRPAPSPANRFAVNEDPRLLESAWSAVFGEGAGQTLVPEEVRWLAVTHKSFDQGRRGFNDRLAFVGKRIVDLQTSLALLAQDSAATAGTSQESALRSGAQEQDGGKLGAAADQELGERSEDGITPTTQTTRRDGTPVELDEYGREIFAHPVMQLLPKLTARTRDEHTDRRRLALLARDFGLQRVVRWKPRAAADLVGSGQDVVLVQALYAMVGALALHRGGDMAVKAVRTRILPRLGLRV